MPARTPKPPRFAAKLLFQFRVMVDGDAGKRRTCEERIVIIRARTAKLALAAARRKGKAGQYSYLNSDQNRVHFDFVGVLDLVSLTHQDDDQVWYNIRDYLLPMERRAELLPPDEYLLFRSK